MTLMTDPTPPEDKDKPARVMLKCQRRTVLILALLWTATSGVMTYVLIDDPTPPFGEILLWSALAVVLGLTSLIVYATTLVREEILTARRDAERRDVKIRAAFRAAAERRQAEIEVLVQSVRAEIRDIADGLTRAVRESETPERITELTERVMQLSERAGGAISAADQQRQSIEKEIRELVVMVRGLAEQAYARAERLEALEARQESLAQDFALAQVLAVRARAGLPARGEVIPLVPRDVDHS